MDLEVQQHSQRLPLPLGSTSILETPSGISTAPPGLLIHSLMVATYKAESKNEEI